MRASKQVGIVRVPYQMIDDDIRILSQRSDEEPHVVKGTQSLVMGPPSEEYNPPSETNRELKNSIVQVIGTHVFSMTVLNDEVVVWMPKDPVISV